MEKRTRALQKSDPQFQALLAELVEEWGEQLRRNEVMDRNLKETYVFAVRQFHRWVVRSDQTYLPRNRGRRPVPRHLL